MSSGTKHALDKFGALAIIPARYNSSRFPGKPLALLRNQPMILHTLYRAKQASGIRACFVATDDERIAQVVRASTGSHDSVIMTSSDCPNGTQRMVQAYHQLCQSTSPAIRIALKSCKAVVNVQGDEPCVHPGHITQALFALMTGPTQLSSSPAPTVPSADVGTVVTPIGSLKQANDPNVVKCVLTSNRRCMYFSRCRIPFIHPSKLTQLDSSDSQFLRHIGIYAFSRNFLENTLPYLRPSKLALMEDLEQLSWLQADAVIRASIVGPAAPSVDVPHDLEVLNQEFDKWITNAKV